MIASPDTVSSPDPCCVEPLGCARPEIEGLASRIAEKCGYQPGGDLLAIVAALGGRVRMLSETGEGPSGHICVRGPGDFDIFLSPYSGPCRNRFTIAHELGHYFLHSMAGEVELRIAREGCDRAECEANWFAAAFLMPEAMFRTAWEEHGADVATVAAFFLVSRQATDIRARRLGLK